MAMIQRVSSMDAINTWRSRSVSPAASERRKLSFNPVQAGAWGPAAQEELVPAFEVSKTRRMLQVFAAVVYCLLAAGIVFGYAAIKPVLIAQGVYRDRCTDAELDKGVRVCYEQELRLNFMFTVAAVSTNVCALPVGTILDRFGPRASGLIGVLFLTIGALFFAFAADLSFDGYIPGYLFMALGGPFVFISSFQLSNTFPRYSGLILALLTGAFDTSSALFLFYRLLYQATGGDLTPKKFFLIYLVVPVYILIVQITLMPSKSYETVGELASRADDAAADYHDSDDDILEESIVQRLRNDRRARRESLASEITALLDGKDTSTRAEEEEKKKENSGVWGALHGKTAAQQILTPWFILITLFTVIQMTRINYFVATIRSQYEYLLGDYHKAVRVNSFFDVALPLGGVISVPFIGLVLDNTSTPFVLALLVVFATTIGVLGVIPELWAAYANICLFVVYRPFYYTAVSDYAAKVFGFATFGKVYGLIICLAGLLNFLQSGLDALTHRVFHNNPIPVNIILMSVAFVIGLSLVAFVTWKSKVIHRERVEEDAEDAREVLMPGAEMGFENIDHANDIQNGDGGSPRLGRTGYGTLDRGV
ncbi:putative major facilitator superfamily transporter protein [Lasiodiplodia theobromae]|uniref:Protein FMP42 n=2 Tax=Lasiodiplodia TaxID=66739 RepID=A0A5N5D9S2_9PEZI|nr:MFS transporter [Lasiodiplodia theobromae]KAB2574573.1 Protein FMP42 [Lasiodiplodia theobromae]KAF4537920.1 MFS transporter [Lasiodiplodia theobromae]KAF9635561.1 putative major facilitator superfamily transporter protein [Lasiodiplodia theobromae]KAK0664882.1 Protein FMP42 [Lasiodiplodia hormozganensis]